MNKSIDNTNNIPFNDKIYLRFSSVIISNIIFLFIFHCDSFIKMLQVFSNYSINFLTKTAAPIVPERSLISVLEWARIDLTSEFG